jgi:GTPase SAR1 family protein
LKIELTKPNYIYLKVTPATSIRNNDTYKIAQAIQSTYKPFFNRFTFHDYKQILNNALPQMIKFELPYKTAYMIYITKKTVEFYFIIDERYRNILKEALSRVWSSVTIYDIKKLPEFSQNALYKQLVYAKEDALSLAADRRDNDLISNNLNIIDVLQENEKVGIFYNFIPTSQYSWRAAYKNTLDKYKTGNPVDKNKINLNYIVKSIFNEIYLTINMFNKNTGVSLSSTKELSNFTYLKGSETILNTQIALVGDSYNKLNSINNLRSLANSFRSIDNDNYLRSKNAKKFNFLDLNIGGYEMNKCSINECGNFLSLPGRELLERFGIEHINTLETEIPEELQSGYIKLGTNTYKGKTAITTMSADKNLANLGLVALGPQGCGKSTFFGNYAKDVSDKDEGLILIDFIKNCELSNEIERVVPKNKLIVLDLSKQEDMQSFSFNEVNNFKVNSDYDRLVISNMQTQLTVSFIDSINLDQKLTPRMRRSLVAAANVVFINKNMSMRNVVECISDHRKRIDYINRIPEGLKEYLKDDIFNLEDMNEVDKAGEISGTKSAKSDYVLDRISVLMEDIKLKVMFNKPMDKNLDLIKAMDDGKLLLIKIPESHYPTKTHKNILTTFFISKIWLASQLRGGMYKEPRRTHIIIDEVFQAPTTEYILRDVLVQCRKFQTKFVFSAHYLSQIDTIKEALKASGSSYMLMQGTDKKNFEELKEDLAPFELQDLLNLKRYHSLNLIKTSNGYSKFITELPKPI